MKSKDLLIQLAKIEQSLHEFSYDELNSKEASTLKRTFENFKKRLEKKIFHPQSAIMVDNVSDYYAVPTSKENKIHHDTEATKLIARVSHEIRTPLNGIIGFTDLLKEDDLLNKQQFERVEAIQKASYSLMEIISELLEFSKLSAGMENFEAVNFDFRNVIGDVRFLCETLISEKKIDFSVDVDQNVPKALIGDPSKLSQVLLNLLGNAIKFVDDGSITLRIKVQSELNNPVLLDFSIADTGIGISEEHIGHIFDSFKQAESTTFVKYGGSGLGLNIVKQIIENLGGHIEVSSELGVGTTFNFQIPYKKGNPEKLVHKKAQAISSRQIAFVGYMNVLVFEDNQLNQKLIDERLKSWGCKVHITDDAREGIKILEEQKINLILMDLKMPGKNGFEVTELIRTHENKSINQLPVIALSADFSENDRKKCRQHKINDFILKPFKAEELLEKIIKNKSNMERTLMIESFKINPLAINEQDQAIDLAPILEECMGEIGLLKELIMLFNKNAMEFIGAAKVHLKNGDIQQLEFAAHKIKSGLKMMHCNSLLSIIEQIQKSCKENVDMKHLEFLYSRFVEEYPNVNKEIAIALKKLKPGTD